MSLQVYTGPMYSNKTTKMVGEINKLSDVQNKKALIINHCLDNRSNEIISSHSSIHKLGSNIDTISTSQLSKVDVSDYTMIGIDEINFFDDEQDLIETIKLWISQNKHIICAGLDGDARMKQFGYISSLLPISDSFIKLNAICVLCKQELIDKNEELTPTNSTPAPFTKKLSNITEIIDVGGKDKYIAVCRKHFN